MVLVLMAISFRRVDELILSTVQWGCVDLRTYIEFED